MTTKDFWSQPGPPTFLLIALAGLLVVLLCLPAMSFAQGISQEEIQRLQQLSPSEREKLASQFRQQKSGAASSAIGQENVDSTDDSVIQAVDSRERDKLTRRALKDEVRRYRDKASVPTGELEPFGYALFAGESSTFAPATEIPVPSEYRIGPGDVVRLQLFGQQNELYELQVSRDGTLQMPKVGPISVAGLDFDEMRRQLSKLIAERFIGVEASITLGELRSIRIFVMGEARNPGAYTVSSLSNITNALFVSGGVKVSGSLRGARLIRDGRVVAAVDLYDLLLKGDTSSDQRLMPGDVIFIPTVGKTAAIGGQVKRPAIYELGDEKTIAELLLLAGGYREEASPRFAKLRRINEQYERVVEDIDLTHRATLSKTVRNGDEITVGAIDDLREGFIQVSGAALRPGIYEWRPGLRVSDILPSANDSLKVGADLGFALIVREIDADRDIAAVGFGLGAALSSPGGESDPVLQDRDELLVFDRATSRNGLLGPVIERLDRQVSPGEAPLVVSVSGQVRHPGRYPLTKGMTLKELLRASGGLMDSSYLGQAEIARTVLEQEQASTHLIEARIDLSREAADEVYLQARDSVLIKQLPAFGERLTVTLKGEFRFPGTYTIRRGEMLSSLIERAGGLTPHGYARGAVFTRVSLRKQEQARLSEAENRLRKDLAGLSLEGSAEFRAVGDESAAEKLESVLEQVKSTEAMGRMVIDLPVILGGISAGDVRLADGDMLIVPEKMQSVTVVGEVQFATSHLFQPGYSVEDFLERSGGLTRNADEGRVYVIRADGSVWLPSRSRWFSGRNGSLEPGDTIVVPLDIDQINRLELATGLSQVIYQIALGAAAVRSF